MFVLAGVLGGVALWAHGPTLTAETLIARYTNGQSRFIEIAGVRAHVRDEGRSDAIPVVLVHGSNGSLHMWEGWAKELGARARLVSVDLPGHGLTGAWPRDDYTIEAFADFVEVLADTLHLERFALAGHSMGGAIAWTFAATRPDRVSHLVLVDAAGYPRDSSPPLALRIARIPVVGDIAARLKPDAMVRRSLSEVYADPTQVTEERVRRYADLQRFPGNRDATLRRVRTQEPLDPTPLRRLDVPTLILWGVKDRWVPVSNAFRFQEDIKGAQLMLFEHLGHNPMEEDARATAAALDAFLPRPPPLPDPPAVSAVAREEEPVGPAVEPVRD